MANCEKCRYRIGCENYAPKSTTACGHYVEDVQQLKPSMKDKEALTVAKEKLHRAIYLSECGCNEGIQAIYAKEAEWLSVIIRNAEENITRKEREEK